MDAPATRTEMVPLRGFGCAPSEARVVVRALTPRQRLTRAGAVFGAGLVAALIALPIPIVHFMLVPGSLLAGIVLGVVRLRHREIVDAAEASCPCCGAAQRLPLSGRVFRLPRTVHCEQCHRALDLG